jgi:putative DNA primase/helicase
MSSTSVSPRLSRSSPARRGSPLARQAISPTAARAEAADDRADSVAKARERWGEAIDPRGTIVEKYLTGRGLELGDDIAGEAIRFHPACPWKDDDGALIHVPVMICAMRDIQTDELVAVSRRRLTREGQKVGKPRFLGAAAGAAIKLDADEDVTNGLHICEGVETGIAGRMRDLRPMWALGSKGAIETFPVLGGIDCLTILAEPDAEAAVEKCARRWYEAGREVIINRSKIGKDLADAVASVRS